MYGYFKRQTDHLTHKKTWTWLKKRWNLKKGTKSFLVIAQNNVINTSYVKAKVDNTQENGKCRFCEDKNERVDHIISKCNKQAHNIKNRLELMGVMIHWKLWHKYKFDHTIKWYMDKPASFLENEIFCDFDIQTDHLISARRPDLVLKKLISLHKI